MAYVLASEAAQPPIPVYEAVKKDFLPSLALLRSMAWRAGAAGRINRPLSNHNSH